MRYVDFFHSVRRTRAAEHHARPGDDQWALETR